ncbi:TonB-dependent receptor [Undibacterium sp. RTI2.1]|uniref:TonB-dependent receptor n=1 Tax=unclassified Undibacterium TaxID=2630295 RepID=UPI002B239B12|nr:MULTISPECIES: TonB-dependent receptor [unclassified Undibacterium]MEB0029397.1 TonB-dependent receptor [Undibacterium sp. RTI2.1]MEB0115984.1 TonB-dependent receptor [Undibacterium sp. RTI2.2]
MLKKKNIAVLTTLALLCMQATQAQTNATKDADNTKNSKDGDAIQTVTVAGNYDNAIGTSNAASQGSVTANLISNRPALRTGELLEFVPGMIVTQHSGDGKANQYFLRGFNLDHGTDFATYVDGMPVNMRSHAHGQGYSDLNFLMPELVQRIDYKKGPYFADEGDFASAGAAHIRLVDKLPQGIASLSLGSYGYQRAVLANSLAAANGTLLYGLELNRNNGPWDTPENVRKYSGILRYSQGTQDDGFNVTAMAYKNSWNSTDQVPLRAVQSGLIDRFGAIDPNDGGQTSRYSLSYSMRKRTQDSLFEMDAYAVQSSLDLFSNFTYFLDNPDGGDQFNQSERRRMLGFNVSQSWFSNIGGLDMRNKVGLQTRYDNVSPVGIYNTVAQQRISTIRQDEVKEASAGLYAENTIQWLPKLRSIAGVRYDAYHFDVNSSIQGDSGKVNDHIVSPKLSLIFGPWDKTEYFANYGSGFHSNDARGTTQTRLPDGGASTPVTPLVKTKGGELGMRTEIIPGLQSSLALWRLDIDSELLFVGDAGETEPSRASRRTGIEWNNHYIAAPWLLLDLDLAASRARYTQYDPVGAYIPGSIDRVASFGVTVTDVGRWYGGFDLRYFGPRPLVEDNSVRSSSTTLAYARVGYKISPKTKLTLDVFNLFDKQASDIDYYYQSRLKGESPDGVNDVHFHPVEPRTMRLSLVHNF